MPRKRPTFVVIDDFLDDPQALRDLALRSNFVPDLNHYKGRRTFPYRDPAIRVVFENVLDAPIVDWDNQPYNGSFQRTGPDDPIVWHADTQTYAAAIYLDPGCHPEAGTSFWRHRDTHCRRSPWHPREYVRFNEESAAHAHAAVFNEYNFVHSDPWELVDRVAAVFNRCVIWDAKLIHSATSYQCERLVQLFFFTIAE